MKNNGLIKRGIDQDIITLTQEKVYYKILQTAFPLTPEEEVRIEAYLTLIFVYDYPAGQIAFEHPVKMGSDYRRVDIVVFEDYAKDKIFLLVECKRKNVGDTLFKEATSQGFSYDNHLYVKYIWITSGDRNAYFKTQQKEEGRDRLSIYNIPNFSKQDHLSYKLQESWSIVSRNFSTVFQEYVLPQLKKAWFSTFLLYLLAILAIGLGVSWLANAYPTHYIIHKTNWLRKIHFGDMYNVVLGVSVLLYVGILQRKIFPQSLRRSKTKYQQNVRKIAYLLTCFVIIFVSYLITKLAFGLEHQCLKCRDCIHQWNCWWGYKHYISFAKDVRFLIYYIPFLVTSVVQAFILQVVSWFLHVLGKI